MSLRLQHETPGATHVLQDVDTRALRRIYLLALHAVRKRVAINEEVERRLATIVLFAYSATAEDGAGSTDEGVIVASCVERLIARTTSHNAT